MQYSNLPTRIQVPFAESGPKNTVPVPSQVSITPGAASFTTGFPPLTMTPVAAGGVPPFGQDMNGVLFDATAWARWQSAGGMVQYDSSFSTAVGGYPLGAILASALYPLVYWCNAVDNNTSNPDTGGAGWTALSGAGNSVVFGASGTFVVPAGVTRVKVRAWGGGGGGGGAGGAASAGTAGVSGAFGEGYFDVTPGASFAVTIGAGGIAGGGAGNNGSNGGTSSFGALLTAGGGSGGVGSTSGAASWGSISGPTSSGGGIGFPGTVSANAYLIGGTYLGSAGPGSPQGGSTGYISIGPGLVGGFPGGGGGGAACNGTPNNAGAGAGGFVIVEWV